jgi:uncharacterized membrane protein
MMQALLRAYPALIVAHVLLDTVWLKVIAKSFYQREVGALLAPDDQVRMGAALLFYLLYAAGLYLFVVAPALRQAAWRQAILLGAAFGLVAYGTFDLTVLFAFKGWTVAATAVDMAWGGCASSLAAAIGYAAGRTATR